MLRWLERGALGEPRRARGVLDVDRVEGRQARCHVGQPSVRHGCCARQQRLPRGAPEQDHALEAGDLVADLLDHRRVVGGLEGRCGNQQLHPGLVEHVLQLVRAVCRVDVDEDRAHLRGGVLDQNPLGAVRRPDAHPVARHDARAEQRPGQGVDVSPQLGIRPSRCLVRRRRGPPGRRTGAPCRRGSCRSSSRSAVRRSRRWRWTAPWVGLQWVARSVSSRSSLCQTHR